MCPARATRLTMATLKKALQDDNVLLFMEGGQILDPLDEGYKIIREGLNAFHFVCSPENHNRAISPDGEYLFIPTKTTQKEKA